MVVKTRFSDNQLFYKSLNQYSLPYYLPYAELLNINDKLNPVKNSLILDIDIHTCYSQVSIPILQTAMHSGPKEQLLMQYLHIDFYGQQ